MASWWQQILFHIWHKFGKVMAKKSFRSGLNCIQRYRGRWNVNDAMVNSLKKKVFLCTLGFERRHICVLWWGWKCQVPDSPVAGHAGARRSWICPTLRSQEPACHPPLLLLLVAVVAVVAVVLELAVEVVSYPVAPNTVVALSVAHWVCWRLWVGSWSPWSSWSACLSLSACQLVQVEVAVEEQQHTRFLTDDPKS